jgi:hypothetical protein
VSPDAPKATPDPLWMLQIDWLSLIHKLGLGHPLKFLWEGRAQHLTTDANFWKQFYPKFPRYRQASVTAREFVAGERVEVDYAGRSDRVVDLKTGKIHRAECSSSCSALASCCMRAPPRTCRPATGSAVTRRMLAKSSHWLWRRRCLYG